MATDADKIKATGIPPLESPKRADSQSSVSSMLADFDGEDGEQGGSSEGLRRISKVGMTWFIAGGMLLLLVILMLIFDIISLKRVNVHMSLLVKNTGNLAKKSHGKKHRFGSYETNLLNNLEYQNNPHHLWLNPPKPKEGANNTG